MNSLQPEMHQQCKHRGMKQSSDQLSSSDIFISISELTKGPFLAHIQLSFTEQGKNFLLTLTLSGFGVCSTPQEFNKRL